MSDETWVRDWYLSASIADAKAAVIEAAAFRSHAANIEADHPDLAKRYREAAHHQEMSAACLDGSRQFATEAELAETRAKYGEEADHV